MRLVVAGAMVAASGAAGMVAAPAGAMPTVLTLSASASTGYVGHSVTLTATASEDPGSLYIDIWDTNGTFVGACVNQGPSCSIPDWQSQPGRHTYIAFLDRDRSYDRYPPHHVVATSNTVTVTWVDPPPPVNPSTAYCPAPTLPVLDGQVGPLTDKVVVEDDGSRVALCYRIDGAGEGVGGAIVVTQTTSSPRVDGHAELCQTELFHQNVLAQLVVAVGVGGDTATGEKWLCVQVGSVGRRVVVPANPVPDVTWWRD
jgi:hypothetical protein